MNVLFIGGFDSTNYAYVEVIRELDARGHHCVVLVEGAHDAVNSKMLMIPGVERVAPRDFRPSRVRDFDVVFTGPFAKRSLLRVLDELRAADAIVVSFANLFSSVTMRIPVDVVITSSTSKFREFESNGLAYTSVAIGNPQYDPLIRRRLAEGPIDRTVRKVLVADQGAYPFGSTGKGQLAAALIGMALHNPGIDFHVKPRYAPDEVGDHLHSMSEHLFGFLVDRPSNLVLLQDPGTLEDILPGYDSMVTTWSTAHLAAVALGMPLMILARLDSQDVFDVRSVRVSAAYRHLAATGCVVDWEDAKDGACRFSRVARGYALQEFYDPDVPASPRVVDLIEALVPHVQAHRRFLRRGLVSGFDDLMERLRVGEVEDLLEPVPSVLDRELYQKTNDVIQTLVFENRCMGGPMDMSRMLPFWSARLGRGASRRELRDAIRKVQTAAQKLKEDYFGSHPAEVAADEFVQDQYFDWLYQSHRYSELESYAGPLVAPQSLEYDRGLALLRKGHPLRAARHVTKSFSLSLERPIRILRKDKNISVLLSRTDRSILSHAVLFLMRAHGRLAALQGIDVPRRPGFEALVYYRVRSLIAAGRLSEAEMLYRGYAPFARAVVPGHGSRLAGVVLHVLRSLYRARLRALSQTLGPSSARVGERHRRSSSTPPQ